MTSIDTYINTLNDIFVKFASRQNLKKFCETEGSGLPDSAFTRDRIFNLPVLLGRILSPMVHSGFVDNAAYLESLGLPIASLAAFSKRRGIVPYKYMEEYHDELVRTIYQNNLAPRRWNSHLLLACDGTTYSLPDTKSMKEKFLKGRKTGKTEQPLARGDVIKDVLNDIVIDADMECYGEDEIRLAIKMFKKLPEVVRNLSPVVLCDRKYCCYPLIAQLAMLGIGFIIRLKKGFNKEVDAFMESSQKEKIVTLNPAPTTVKKLKRLYRSCPLAYEVRLIRCSDNVVVMTSLLDDHRVLSDTAEPGPDRSNLPVKDTYALRWTDETTIDFMKNNLQVEVFSTIGMKTMYQDFYSKLINYNVVTLLAHAAAQMRLPDKKGSKYRHGINRNDTLGLVAVLFWKSLVLNKFKQSGREMLKQIGRNVWPIIPDRHNPRVFRKIKHSGKFITLTNFKTAI